MAVRVLAVGLPPLLLAVAGLAHPMTLSPATSRRWTTLHVALVPVFPLLAVCLWLLLRSESGLLATLARAAVASLRPVLQLGNTLVWVGSIAFLLAAARDSEAGRPFRRRGVV